MSVSFPFLPLLRPPVGVSEHLAQLETALNDSPLVTILGPPGAGKTTLARAAAQLWLQQGPGRQCRWVEATEPRAELAPDKPPFEPPKPADAACLLVVDGLRSDRADRDWTFALVHWLAGSPKRRVLVTSSRRLACEGEVTVLAKPLSVDAAVALFESEARAVDVTYVATPAEREATRQLVQRVGMLPLAVKMCAAQTTVLRPVALQEHLSSPSARLALEDSAGLSLDALIGATLELLDPALKASLAACVVFEGPFSPKAAQHIVPASLATLKRLAERSLLDDVRTATGRSLQVIPVIADYLRHHERGDGSEAVEQRHSAFYRSDDAAELAPEECRRNLLVAAANEVGAEHWKPALDCLAVAAPWVLRRGGVRRALALYAQIPQPPEVPWTTEDGLAYARLLTRDGRLEQAMEAIKRVEAGDEERPSSRAELELERAGIARVRGEHSEAALAYSRCIELADAELRAVATERWGGLCFELGDTQAAAERFARAGALYAQAGDAQGLARVGHAQGVVAQQDGHFDQARAHFIEAVRQHEVNGDARGAAIARFDLATLSMEEADWTLAAEAWPAVLKALDAVGDQRQWCLALALQSLCVFHTRPDAEGAREAARGLENALEHARRIQDRLFVRAIEVHRRHLSRLSPDVDGSDPSEASDTAPRADGVEQATSDEERFAWRLLHMAQRDERRRVVLRDGGAELCCDGVWNTVRSTAARRILMALAQARTPLTAQDLLGAGWPGDRSLTSSAKNRLHVALSALRKAGLGDRLKREADGYVVDAEVRWPDGRRVGDPDGDNAQEDR